MADAIPVLDQLPLTIVDVSVAGQTDFDFDFRADEADDLQVQFRRLDGSRVDLASGIDFTATGLGIATGGTVSLTSITNAVLGEYAVIYREIVIDREHDYIRDLHADDLNTEMDRIFMILQDLRRDVARSIKVEMGGSGTTPDDLIDELNDAVASASASKEAAEAAAEIAIGATATVVAGGYPTIAAAKAASPTFAPEFIQVQGYFAPGDGGGGLYGKVASEPAHLFKFFITLQDAVTVAWYELRPDEIIRPEMLGAFPHIICETETKVWYDALSTKPTYHHLCFVDLIIRLLKLAGIWTKATCIVAPVIAPTKADCGINIKNPGTFNGTVLGAGTFTLGVGLDGNNVDSAITITGWNNLINQDAAFIAAKTSIRNFADGDSVVSSIPTGTAAGIGYTPRSLAGNFVTRLNNSAAANFARAYREGDFILSRGSAANYQVYQEGELWQTVSAVSIPVTTETASLLRSGSAHGEDTLHMFICGNQALTAQEAAYLDAIMKKLVRGMQGFAGKGPTCASIGFVEKVNQATMTTAMNACAAKASELALSVSLLLGSYHVSDTYQGPKDLVITEGLHKYLSKIAAGSGLPAEKPLVAPGHYRGGEGHWSLQNLWIDHRATARGITGVGSANRPGPSAVSTDGSHDYTIHDILVTEGVLHGIDVCNTGRVSTGEIDSVNGPTVVGQRYYAPDPAPDKYIVGVIGERGHVWNIEGYASGDDLVTRHYSQFDKTHDISGWIPSGRHPGGVRVSMVCETDDGAYGGEMYNIYGLGFYRVAAIKNHAPNPAPRDVSARRITAERSGSALFVYDANAGDGHNHDIENITLRRPYRIHPTDSFMTALQIDSVSDINVRGVYAEARGDEGDDLYPAIMMLTAKRAKISGVGAKNWKVTNTANSPAQATIRVGSDCECVSFRGLDIRGCGKYAINDSGSLAPDYSDIRATGTGVANSAVIRFGAVEATRKLTYSAVKAIDAYSAGVSGFANVMLINP